MFTTILFILSCLLLLIGVGILRDLALWLLKGSREARDRLLPSLILVLILGGVLAAAGWRHRAKEDAALGHLRPNLASYIATEKAIAGADHATAMRLGGGKKVVVLDTETRTFDRDFLDYPLDVRAVEPDDVGAVLWITRHAGRIVGRTVPAGPEISERVLEAVLVRLDDYSVIAHTQFTRVPGMGIDRFSNTGEIGTDMVAPFVRAWLR